MPLFLVAAAALLVARRPEMLFRPEMYAESGPVFFMPTYFNDPLNLLVTPYAGYLHLIPRLVASLERLMPPAHVPLFEAVVAFAGTVAIAGFLASDRLANVLPSRWARYVLAAMLVVTPTAREVLGIEVNLQVYGSVYLVALAMARPAPTRPWLVADIFGAIVFSLSGPFSLLLAPLFLARRDRLTIVVGVCALAQLGVLLTSPRRDFQVPAIGDAIEAGMIRINSAVLGPVIAQLVPRTVAILLLPLLVVIAMRAGRRRGWAPFAVAACLIGAAGLVSGGVASEVAQYTHSFERFFVMAPIAVAAIILSGLASDERICFRASQLAGALVLVGVLVHLRVPPLPDADWPTASMCIGSDRACLIEVAPRRFSFMWPGTNGEYPPPRDPSEVVGRALSD